MKRGVKKGDESGASTRPSAMQEAIQAVVASALAGVAEIIKGIRSDMDDVRKTSEALAKKVEAYGVELLELEGKSSTLEKVLKLSEDLDKFKASLPAEVDRIMSAELSTPMTCTLKLADLLPARRAEGPAAGEAGKKPTKRKPAVRKAAASGNRSGKYQKRPPCPTCQKAMEVKDYGAPKREYVCRHCKVPEPAATPA
ncbi:MAG: hypothetical protein NTY77_05545 [Elusimicrobia bacterium]|nr:hypothetical protein [Elusimicrobiota bacterium]